MVDGLSAVVRGITDPFVVAQFCGLPVELVRDATVAIRDGVLVQALERAPTIADIAAAWVCFARWLLESCGFAATDDAVDYVLHELAPPYAAAMPAV